MALDGERVACLLAAYKLFSSTVEATKHTDRQVASQS